MKRGYLGPFQYFYLAGLSAGYRYKLQDLGVAEIDNNIPLAKMIYVAAFQGGIEKFVTHFKGESSYPLDRFIAARTSAPKQRSMELYKKILTLEPAWEKVEERNAMGSLGFIADLMVAMENKAALMYVSGIPKVEEVQRYLPPDVALPICAILSAIKSADELLPAPSVTVNQNVVRKFKDLLNSDIYHRYTNAHEGIEYGARIPALSNIRRRGAELLRAGEGVLANRRVSLNIISVVPKIVDTAFGRLPGALAQVAGDLATKFMEDKRNIVIYQFDDWANAYLTAQMLYLRDRLQ